MKEDTQKALEEFIQIREGVDALLAAQGNKAFTQDEMEKLGEAFTREKEAKKRYYSLLAEEMGWSQEERDELFKGAGLKERHCEG